MLMFASIIGLNHWSVDRDERQFLKLGNYTKLLLCMGNLL